MTIAEDCEKAFSGLRINKSSYIVTVTRNHQYDELVLEQALATQANYIGLMGSKARNKVAFSHFLTKGISQEQLNKVYNPIGLEIDAQTPEEIAVSILAEIIIVRRSGLPDSHRGKASFRLLLCSRVLTTIIFFDKIFHTF